MAFNINDFRSALQFDGARPNLFEVSLVWPGIVEEPSTASTILIKSSQLPGSTIGSVPVYYFGREIKLAGNRTFTDWTVTVINDEDFSIRNSLEAWMDSINSHVSNIRSPGSLAAGGPNTLYTTDGVVTQYGKVGDAIKTFLIVGMFPIDLSPIDLDWGTNDSIEEYQVTFAYQYWLSDTTSDETVGPLPLS